MAIQRICLKCHLPIKETKRKVKTVCQCKQCELCGSPWHYKTFCQLNTKRAIKKRNPIRVMGKTTKEWLTFRKEYLEKTEPNEQGFYECYLCGKWLYPEEVTLDHKKPRSSHPELRFIESNIAIACFECNRDKGSKSLENYKKTIDF